MSAFVGAFAARRALEDASEPDLAARNAALVAAIVLVAFRGLFSGLNLGLMSFSAEDLKIIIKGSGDPDERIWAQKILPLRDRGNLLLCTLLLGNTLVNAVIAILLADIASGTVGALVTTALIVVFGEIIPQSVCSRHGLRIGAMAVPIVWAFVYACWVVAYPISILLDFLLGREVTAVYSRHELLALVALNVESPAHQKESGLTEQDGRLLQGALKLPSKTVSQIMTKLEKVYMLELDAVLDWALFKEILEHGHTRIPIWTGSRENIVALLNTKDLLGLGFERRCALSTVVDKFDPERSRVVTCSADDHLDTTLARCKKRKQHLLVVKEFEFPKDDAGMGTRLHRASLVASGSLPAGRTVGIVTLEDVLEEVLGEEIVDEYDVYEDNGPVLRRVSTKAGHSRDGLLRELAPPVTTSSSAPLSKAALY